MKKRWEQSSHGAVKSDAFANLNPGCTLKTVSIYKVVEAVRRFAIEESEGANRSKGVMMATIIRSCHDSMAKWVQYDLYEKRIDEVKLNANANASGTANS